jgi:hypothetical protein
MQQRNPFYMSRIVRALVAFLISIEEFEKEA